MEIETTTTKNMRDGWMSESVIPMNVTTEEGEMQVRVTTMKRYSGHLGTTATVVYQKADSFSFMAFQDFSKTISSVKLARVTAAVCESNHKAALETMPAVIAEIRKFYKMAEAA